MRLRARPVAASLAALALALLAPAARTAAPVTGAAPADSAVTARVDLNAASESDLIAIGLPAAVAGAIVDHRTFVSWFTSVYDLLSVPGITPELFAWLKPRVVVAPAFETAAREQDVEQMRAGELEYVVQRLLSEEGASEGLVDSYVDQIRDPRDVNRLDYSDLASYQNVSPVDAVAVLRERAIGRIENARQLRSAPGLSYWGFRNLRDFVNYGDSDPRDAALLPPVRPRVDVQVRAYDTPYTLDDRDILEENILQAPSGLPASQAAAYRDFDLNTYAGRLDLGATDPSLTQKVRVRWGDHWRAAWLTHRNLGETSWNATQKGFLSLEDLPAVSTRLGPLTLHRAVLGGYTVSFGLGLVMDATDFFTARQTGLGYSVRPLGVQGDLSRSDEYALNGGVVEASLGALRGTFFGSRADKDAILNPDGSFNRYIRMVPRVSNDLLAAIRHDIDTGVFAGQSDTSAFLPMRDVMDERLAGAHLQWEFAPGTWVGATGVDIRTRNRFSDAPGADRWDPDPRTLVTDPNRLEDRDAELGAGYDSRALGNYRRVWGLDGQTVWRNLSLTAEYGKLETSARSGAFRRLFAGGPEARVAQLYAQWENLNLLALWRDYDVGYDDPYDRAFGEDDRYEQTILDANAYRLKNPYWAMLARDTPQPKAERGWYFNTRWQPLPQFLVSGFEFDTWKRLADGADLYRVVGRLEYRPIFPLRLRLRQAVSARHADRPDDIRAYRSWDSRLELLANLSHFDQLRFLFSTSNVTFAERGRLSGPAAGGEVQSDTTAQRGSPARAFQAQFTHQFNPDLAVTLSTEVFDGFLYNYEDNEFVVVDGQGFRNWVMLRSRLSPNLSWRLKWTWDHQRPRTYVDIRDFGALVPPTPDGTDAIDDASAFRFQLDLSL